MNKRLAGIFTKQAKTLQKKHALHLFVLFLPRTGSEQDGGFMKRHQEKDRNHKISNR